jgi:hypothetical protein
MRTSYLLIVVLYWSTFMLKAQNVPVTKITKLPVDEVPSVVRLALEKDFGTTYTGGYWTVHHSNIVQHNGRTVANPIWYTYNQKDKEQRIEVRYSPKGKLKSMKGIAMREEDNVIIEKDKLPTEKDAG